MARQWWKGFALGLGLTVAAAACGEDEDCGSYDGVICNNCATDCDAQCGAGETETCVGLEFFGDDNPDDLRCAWCE